MAVVKGVKEKVHLPLYDAIAVRPKEQLGRILSSNVLRFFQDVTGKTKLLTNMQASSLLPHWNTYEARALRVVISDLPAQFTETPTAVLERKLTGGNNLDATVTFSLRNFVELKRRIEGLHVKPIEFTEDFQPSEFDLVLAVGDSERSELEGNESFVIDHIALKEMEENLGEVGVVIPPNEQIFPNNGFGTVIGKIIFNTVTTFFVGEKIMIQVPTWFFPAGAGPYSDNGNVTTHGFPSPKATFCFSEPVMIEAQQTFRVEVEVTESEVLSDLQKLYGPLFIWVTLDGYMTRDVQ
jgi:hypothetical protein